MKISDETLTAFLDGELDDATAAEVAREVDADAALKARLSALDVNLPLMRKDYGELAETAPLEVLRAAILTQPPLMAANSNTKGWSRSVVAAACAACLAFGVVISPITLGNIAGFRGAAGDIGTPAEKSWRQSVAEYQALYSAETLTLSPQDPVKQDETLAKLSERIGVPLDRAKLELDKARFQRGQLLSFDGKPLVQLAYLHDGDKPFALCMVSNGAKDAGPASETRKSMPIVHWAKGGVSYMVIGQVEAEELAVMAEALRSRL
jgi:anti-sigma factor RsiW